ncbi:MAG: CPBP family intramembrane metalloprotease [Anaerolineae bacterium]|nr:CPBP family intramembrane metalloprotease [Anaerolineae bacterium]
MVKVFWNTQQARLRTFWRLLIQSILGIVGIFVVAVIGGSFYFIVMIIAKGVSGAANILDVSFEELAQSPGLNALAGVASLLATLLSVSLVGYFLDRRRFRDFGFHLNWRWGLDLGFGLFLGAILMAGIFAVEWWAGWIEPVIAFNTQPDYLLQLGAQLILYLCVGIYEELSSRGYQLRNLAEGLKIPAGSKRGGVIAAWIMTSVWFGILHAGNENTTVASTLNLVVAGVFLGLGYVLTGELAISIGLHITWNLFQGTVFGFPVSGGTFGNPLITLQQGGPTAWTGGAFGPEAGLIGILAMIAGSILMLAWVFVSRRKLALQTSLAEYVPRNAAKEPSQPIPEVSEV